MGNVSSVDLDELLKARQELNSEKGVETDPNMYSDYNPNREEEKKESEAATLEDSVSLESSYENNTNESSNETTQTEKIDDFKETISEEKKEDSEQTSSEENSDDDSFADMLADLSETANAISEENEETKSQENISDDYIKSLEAQLIGESTPEENKSEEPKPEEIKTENDNSDKFDMFASFEVKENVNYHSEPKVENVVKDESSVERTTNLEKIEQELMDLSKSKIELFEESDDSPDETHEEIESAVETIDNAEELAKFLDNLIDDIDNDVGVEKIESKSEDTSQEDNSSEAHGALAEIDVEPKLDDVKLEETKPDDDFDAMKEDIDSFVSEEKESIESSQTESEKSDIEESTDALSAMLSHAKEETKQAEENQETVENDEETENTSSESAEVDSFDRFNQFMVSDDEIVVEEKPEEKSEEKEVVDESEDDSDETEQEENLDVGIEDIGEILGRKKVEKPTESIELESYDASKAKPAYPRYENVNYNEDAEIITDYNQLREVLQRELKESELAAQKKDEEEEDVEKYANIDDFKFINEIATDDFKSSDKFSYIMGKDERGEMVYGNFREHFNLAVFGRNEDIINSFLNSMVLSLCLKNSTDDINFVMLDSDINSPFEIYNKSSYLYFNRTAKTNKEILDTLIEVTKELDERYDKIADVGLGNIEQYNDMASETGTDPMPNLVIVFNNYTSASQATYIDKINACLYQILKYGRLVGMYIVLTAKLPIESNQVNYNLSSRLSFKSDKDPKYNVGVESVAGLPDENDAIYFNISKNTTVHIKTATVTDTELDLIIKELEE